MFSPDGRLMSGMEELFRELAARPRREQVRLTLSLHPGQVHPDTADRVAAAIGRYCRLRLRQNALSLKEQRREGLGALPLGCALFVIGLVFSYVLTRQGVDTSVQFIFGNGVFVVLWWVGLWYPLDTLVFSLRPLLRERYVLRAMAAADLQLRVDENLLLPAAEASPRH